jgi:hypothetical protein
MAMEAPTCARCGRTLAARARFHFYGSSGLLRKCFPCALQHPPMLRRSAVIALVVGTILTAINHGDLLLGGQWSPTLAWKIPLTYAVPFVVAALGALTSGMVPKGQSMG